MTGRALEDPRLAGILDACYEDICAGREPDMTSRCAAAPELRAVVERILRREQDLLRACAGGGHADATSDRCGGALPPMPSRIGDFTLLEPIGIGGMSHVYRARQEPLGREVALKVLRDEVVAGTKGRLRFQREATITASLDHPHIVPVFAAGEADGHVYLAMKLLRGRSLDRAESPLSPAEVARIGVEAASALQAAHDIGVVHRDVKPANIVVEQGRTFVVDFGLAAFAQQASLLTRPHTTPGTLLYLPPELIRRPGPGLDPRIDVYGLGATLYELLAGRPAFAADNPVRALQQILHADPSPLGLAGRDRDLETIVLRAFDKLPRRRFQTAGELAAELERFRAGVPIHSRPLGCLERGLRVVQRHPLPSALITMAVALLLALIVVLAADARERIARVGAVRVAVGRAVAGGDLQRARARLTELADLPGGAGVRDELVAEIETERRLQLLMATLQSPVTHLDPRSLRELSMAIARSTSASAASPRAATALAIAARLLRDPLDLLVLPDAVRRRWPRTASSFAAFTSGGDPAAALVGVPDSVDEPLDHVNAALVLRLAHRAEGAIEAELRRARAWGPDGSAVRFSLAVTLEAQGRFRGAYDLLTQLVDDPAYAAPATSGCARLAAQLGLADEARRHLERALVADEDEPLQLGLSLPSELQVLDELGDYDRFWQKWHAAAPFAAHLPQYWLRGGYAAAARAELDPAATSTARDYFVRGLACAPDGYWRGGLQVAILQLDWLVSPALDSLEPLPPTAAFAAERMRLSELAARAEAFVGEGTALAFDAALVSDALLVAAQARRAIGDRARAWQLLECACRDHGEPEALSQFAYQVGYRIVQVQLGPADGRDADADAAGPLAEAAALGLAYARRVEALAAEQHVAPGLVEQANVGAFLCAFQLGDATIALPLAIRLHASADADESVRAVAELAREVGGIRLDRLTLPPARFGVVLTSAARALVDAMAAGHYTRAQAKAVVDGWTAHRAVANTEGSTEWRAFWDAVRALR